MINSISIDVEEYFHAANLGDVAGPSKWRSLPSRVRFSTDIVLNILARHNVRATFFILGYCARRHPQMVNDIHQAGHEIASHGYGHRIAYLQTPKQFLRDITIAKNILEDLCGEEVIGYRAPNFSITEQNQWAYDSLIDAGYKYDSSCYPVWHPRYKNLNADTEPHIIERQAGRLYCFPLAVAKVGNKLRLPVAGGAYWRLLPLAYTKFGLRSVNKRGSSATCYLHPWELDIEQPNFNSLPFLTRIRHYGGISQFANKLDYLLKQFRFTTISDAAKQDFKDFPNI